MASTDDLNSTAQGIVTNLAKLVSATQRNAFVLGPVTAINNLGTTSMQVIAADTTRTSIVFHNPMSATTVLVCLAPTVATFTLPGGNWIVLPQDYLPLTGNVQGAWNAVAQAGNACSLTITSSSN
jgi:hypothetical protein